MATQQSVISEFLEQSRRLEGQRLASVIPSELYKSSVSRGLRGFFLSYAVWGLGLLVIGLTDHWLFWLPGAALAGLGGWGLHCIAHDCGHGSFSSSKKFSYFIGHLALLPMLYPFHGWRHVHNLHHANTNHVELDTDWRPVSRAVYDRMSLGSRAIYLGTRTIFFWLGTAHYQIISGFRPSMFPSAKARLEVKRSMLFIALVGGAAIGLCYVAFGWLGLLKYVLLPWIGMHAWFSATTLLHHTSPEMPFLSARNWSRNASKLLTTIDRRYSRLLLLLTHNISIHAAHHVAPKVPFYNLQRASAVLQEAYPGMIQTRDFRWSDLYEVVRYCHLYDPETSLYESFDPRDARGQSDRGSASSSALAGRIQ